MASQIIQVDTKTLAATDTDIIGFDINLGLITLGHKRTFWFNILQKQWTVLIADLLPVIWAYRTTANAILTEELGTQKVDQEKAKHQCKILSLSSVVVVYDTSKDVM